MLNVFGRTTCLRDSEVGGMLHYLDYSVEEVVSTAIKPVEYCRFSTLYEYQKTIILPTLWGHD
jgi:hypothetical protein